MGGGRIIELRVIRVVVWREKEIVRNIDSDCGNVANTGQSTTSNASLAPKPVWIIN